MRKSKEKVPGIKSKAAEALSEDARNEHLHVHLHADGTFHNHYHSHSDGEALHAFEQDVRHPHEQETVDESHAFTGGKSPLHTHRKAVESEPILTVAGVSYAYPKRAEPVFEDIHLNALSGSTLAILGNNGAGKSTLLSILAGIVKPTKGKALIAGDDIAQMSRKEIARHIAYVSQQQRAPHLNVYDQVLLGRRPHITWGVSEYDRFVVARAIDRLGLSRFATRYVDELSGGERQKVYIARAIAQEPEVLLLDEPTSALDPKNQMEVLEIVQDITKEGLLATIIVMHDINLALRFCDKFLMMHDGAVIACGGREVVTNEALCSTYDYRMCIEHVNGVCVALPER